MMKKNSDMNPSKRQTIDELQGFTDNELKEIYEDKTDSDNNDDMSSGNSSQVHELQGGSSSNNSLQQVHESHAVWLGDRKVRLIEDEELDAVEDAFWNEFIETTPLSCVYSGIVDGKKVIIAMMNLPRGTPVSLPSTFQLSPESKKFPVMFRYGVIRAWTVQKIQM